MDLKSDLRGLSDIAMPNYTKRIMPATFRLKKYAACVSPHVFLPQNIIYLCLSLKQSLPVAQVARSIHHRVEDAQRTAQPRP